MKITLCKKVALLKFVDQVQYVWMQSQVGYSKPSFFLSKEMCPETRAENVAMEKVPYQQAVGCLNYSNHAMVPILHLNWDMVEHILSYLKEKKKHAYVTLVVVGVVYMTMSDTPTPTMLVTWTATIRQRGKLYSSIMALINTNKL